MKFLVTYLLQVIFLILQVSQNPVFDKSDFYFHISSKDVKVIDRAIESLKKSDLKEKKAYTGTLLMKKAGIVNGPGKKLSLFKEGANLLESEIEKNKNNPEYRFLRLMIQENAPSVLGYRGDMMKDREMIVNYYSSMESTVKNAVLDYSKISGVLKPEDLQK